MEQLEENTNRELELCVQMSKASDELRSLGREDFLLEEIFALLYVFFQNTGTENSEKLARITSLRQMVQRLEIHYAERVFAAKQSNAEGQTDARPL